MQLTVTGKQLDVGEALQTHVAENLASVTSKYFDSPVDTHVVFSREAHLFRADVSVHIGRGITAHGRGEAADPYPAFDLAIDHVAKRLRRHKRRLRDHHKGKGDPGDVMEAHQVILRVDGNGEAGESGDGLGHAVIAEMTTQIPTLTVSEAVMRMDLADRQQLMFRNSAHGGLNMIYRREDGNIGWIDPRGNRAVQP